MGVLSLRQLPIFPLPLALLPGSLLPLHIFEERYKLMTERCLQADSAFGITYSENPPAAPPLGRVGTVAQIMAVIALEDGRKNLLTLGSIRYRTLSYLAMKPYLNAEVELFTDDEEENLDEDIARVRELYSRISSAMKEINGEALPALPDSPEELSFAVANALKMTDQTKQLLLELVSTRKRLQILYQNLQNSLPQYEHSAQLHKLAKTNGRGGYILRSEDNK
ncbi:MAG: LON peptidase substrate-binding domain-containing protein [Acidobacteriota bacterium]|nr:LON peptidase substrate-binding domain-containing protein [Blastocatellia bacterium]MDW8411777.1 LON peptidase substrate-binding domain-containing protein [Acidobacteriota bacterium]